MHNESEKIRYFVNGEWKDGEDADMRSGRDRRRGGERRVYGDRRKGDRRKEAKR